MALQLSELITRVDYNTNRSGLDTRVTAHLNDGLREMARRHAWRDLHIERSASLTQSTYRYSFPSDMNEFYGLRIIDGTESEWLQIKTKFWLNQYAPYPAGDSEGKPEYVCVDGGYFEVNPVPDEAYTVYINMTKWPATLSNSSDTPDIDGVDDALIAYATYQLYASLSQFENANYWQMEFERRLRNARIADGSEPVAMHTRDGVVSGQPTGLPSEYWHRPDIG